IRKPRSPDRLPPGSKAARPDHSRLRRACAQRRGSGLAACVPPAPRPPPPTRARGRHSGGLFPQEPGMRRTIHPALLAAALHVGCEENQMAGHLLYMTLYNFEKLTCEELKNRANGATLRVKDLEGLRDKANASTAGPVVNSVVYGPDYTKARWEQRLYQEEFDRKNCGAPPPETLPPPPAPRRPNSPRI